MKKISIFGIVALLIIFFSMIREIDSNDLIQHAFRTNDFKTFNECIDNNTIIHINSREYKYSELRQNVQNGFKKMEFGRCEILKSKGETTYFVSGTLSGYRFVEEELIINRGFNFSIKDIYVNEEPLMGYLFLGEKFQRTSQTMSINEFLKYTNNDDIMDIIENYDANNTFLYTVVCAEVKSPDNTFAEKFYEYPIEKVPTEIINCVDIFDNKISKIMKYRNTYFGSVVSKYNNCNMFLLFCENSKYIVITVPEIINITN